MTYISFALNEKCPLYTYKIVTVSYEDTEDVLGHMSGVQTPITGKFTVEQSPNCSVRH